MGKQELVFDRTKNFTEPPNRTEPGIFLSNRTGPNRTRYLPQILILLKNITFSASFLVVEAHFYTHLLTKHGKISFKRNILRNSPFL